MANQTLKNKKKGFENQSPFYLIYLKIIMEANFSTYLDYCLTTH